MPGEDPWEAQQSCGANTLLRSAAAGGSGTSGQQARREAAQVGPGWPPPPTEAAPPRLGLPGRAAERLFPSGPAPATGSGSVRPRSDGRSGGDMESGGSFGAPLRCRLLFLAACWAVAATAAGERGRAGPGRGAAGREPGSVPVGSGPHPRAAGGRTDGRMAAGGWLARPASCTDIECFRFVAASPEVRKLQRDQYPHSAAPLTGAGKGDARSSASLSLQGSIGYYRQVSFKLGGSWGCRCLNKPEPKRCGHCGGSPQTARGVRCAPGSSGVPSRPSASRLHSLLEGRAGKRCGCVGGC